ncbi:MAG TPA: ArsA-related P-loop ATPase [Myxococcales bacterium LLY-WYZ-16_1]|nr:ArsA-related P-loop ATPase [Myxococcales bacterium LLY-WYZ-16_1]
MKLASYVRDKRVIVVCGAGGVGKTTTSASLALAGTRCGRRALVLTIDPARRLAQALGIPPTGDEPVQIEPVRLQRAGVDVESGGTLHAWMLDPRVVLEGVVDRFAPKPEDAERIRKTRLYQALCDVMTGLQEYTAAEALYSFHESDAYDLIVLDTPPSRNALDFLDAPRRLARFLDERTLSIFAPHTQRSSAMVRAASKVVQTALSRTFGSAFAHDLQQFMGLFGKLFQKMRVHASGVRELLRSNESAFLVVTSPDPAALDEATYFQHRIEELGLRSEGFVLNRSYARPGHGDTPQGRLRQVQDEPLHRALQKLVPLADLESERVESHRRILARLETQSRSEGGRGATALPFLDEAVESVEALDALSSAVLAPESGPVEPARPASRSQPDEAGRTESDSSGA